MKVTHYQQMMAYLTRPGYDKGGKVLPKKKPQEEIKRRSKINYEKLKKYLDSESQMFIEKELGFAIGGSVETPKRGLVDEPGSYSKNRHKDPKYKKKWYEKNKERILKERRERYKALSPEEKTKRAQKSIEFQKTEEGKKIRAERFKKRKLTKNPLSAVDIKLLNRFKLNLKYSKIVNEIIADHSGVRPNPETLSELVQVHYEIDPEFQKAWKKVAGDVPFSSTNLSPSSLKFNYDRAMAGSKRVTIENFKEELEGLIKSEIEGTGTTYDEFMENGLRLNETYLNDNYKSPTKKAQYQRRYKKVLRSGIGWDPEGKGAQYFFADPKLKTSTIPTKLNARLGTKGFYEPGKFVRAHYFGTIQAKKLYDLGLLSEEAAKNFKERYTWKPDYINVLQGNTYDADVYKAIIKYNKHKDKSLLSKDLNLAATNAKKLGLDIDELTYDNKTKKFNFIDKGRVFQKGGDRELRYLAKNAIKEIANVEAISGKTLTPAAEADIRKAYGKRANRIIKQIKLGIDYEYPNLDDSTARAVGRVDVSNVSNMYEDVVKAVEELPSETQGAICNDLKKGGLSTTCAEAIKKNPFKTSAIIAEKTRTLPDSASARAFNAATKLIKNLPKQLLTKFGRRALGFSTLGASELALEGAFQFPGFQRGESIEDLKDKSILGLYGIGQDLERKKLEREVAVTGQTGALEYYDYLKDTARLNEIDAILNTSGPDEDVSDLLVEKEELQKNLITPTEEQAEQFQNMNLRMVGQVAANRKARGFSPTDLIEEGPSAQDFMTVNKPLSLELGGIFDPMIEQFEAGQVPRSQGATQRRRLRRNPEIEQLYQQGIQRANQNIMFPVEGTFAGGGIAKLAGVDSGPAPKSGPTPQGLDFLMKRGR